MERSGDPVRGGEKRQEGRLKYIREIKGKKTKKPLPRGVFGGKRNGLKSREQPKREKGQPNEGEKGLLGKKPKDIPTLKKCKREVGKFGKNFSSGGEQGQKKTHWSAKM